MKDRGLLHEVVVYSFIPFTGTLALSSLMDLLVLLLRNSLCLRGPVAFNTLPIRVELYFIGGLASGSSFPISNSQHFSIKKFGLNDRKYKIYHIIRLHLTTIINNGSVIKLPINVYLRGYNTGKFVVSESLRRASYYLYQFSEVFGST